MWWREISAVAVAVVVAVIGLGCGGSSSDSSGVAGRSGVEKEAADFAQSEVAKHWAKAPDGWVTARTTGTSFAADHYIREIREITVDEVKPYDLSDGDKLNGFEWAGEVTYKKAPVREAGDPGYLLEGKEGANFTRPKGQWSQWVDHQPEAVQVQKVKGTWQAHEDTWLLRGKMPGPGDWANAGVK